MYEADILNTKGECIGVKLVSFEEISTAEEKDRLANFLENYLVDDLKWKGLWC